MSIRQTKPRAAITNALERAGRPLLPQEILLLAQEEHAGTSLATVYRTLGLLKEDGTVREVELPGEPTRFEAASCAHHHHHHFKCEACGRVFDIEDCTGGFERMLPPGFTLTGHDVVLYGHCRECA